MFHALEEAIKSFKNSVLYSIYNFRAFRHRKTWWHLHMISQIWTPHALLLHLHVFQRTRLDQILLVLHKNERKEIRKNWFPAFDIQNFYNGFPSKYYEYWMSKEVAKWEEFIIIIEKAVILCEAFFDMFVSHNVANPKKNKIWKNGK